MTASAADARTLSVLQYPTVLDAVAGYAATSLGAAHARALTPLRVAASDPDARRAIAAEHARVAAVRAVIAEGEPWPAHVIPDLAAPLARLRVAGSTWSGPELRSACGLLAAARGTHSALRAAATRGVDVAALDALVDACLPNAALEKALDRVVDEAGAVRDAASPDLRRVRRQLRGAEADLIRLLEKVMAGLAAHHRVDDASVTMRNGRWVVPVRREGRGAVGGIVHDTSASGGTVFVEPPAAVEFGNRIRELESEEAREVERILREATETLRPDGPALEAALQALVELDSLLARARWAERHGCAPATFGDPADGLAIVDGRHPLLVARGAAPVVPFSLELSAAERTLLVSGPNTGGKTVLLKAVALLSLLAQAGVPPTVGPGSTLPLYDRVFADIGDEQSIEASLSTFSGHVKNLIEIVREATPASLVLVDELGSGTDPNEGAALGGAVLETLTRRGATTVATTHLGALKQLAHEVPGVVNASLQFDEALLAPTYRLLKGVPGRSYGLSIARRLQMPADVLDRAEARVPAQEREASALIADLEQRQRALDERERAAEEREATQVARAARIAEREGRVRERERELEREARGASRRYVLEARRELEAAIAAVRKAGGGDAFDAAAANARRVAEDRLAAEREAERRLDADAAAAVPDLSPVELGDHVAVDALGGRVAQVVERRGESVVVLAGSVRTTVPLASVRKAAAPRPERAPVERVAIAGDLPADTAKAEIDVRGLRISEIDTVILGALDAAVRADLPAMRIIHGKGTGALRERVGELLASDPRVRSHRLGAWNEGGAGVTVAELT